MLILVVDDSPIDRVRAGRILEQSLEDCVVCFAEDGAMACNVMKESLPDLVVTDLQMPQMDGVQLVRYLKGEYPRIPVILMTAQGSEEIANEALNAGATSYVAKKNLASRLPETIRSVQQALKRESRHSRLMHSLASGELRFLIDNDPDLAELLASHLQELLRCLPLGDESDRLRVGLAIRAAVMNAICFGNLQLDRGIASLESETTRNLIRERLEAGEFSGCSLEVTCSISNREARFVIQHSGPGLDHLAIHEATELTEDRPLERAIVLIESVMDEVEFNPTSRELIMVKRAVDEDECEFDEIELLA